LNSVPASTSLPCSFFLRGYTTANCTPRVNGGTGLSFWKVCTSWASFPSSCAGTRSQPFPANGPDVTAGSYLSGHASDLPAAVAFATLPTDSSYSNSYSITGSNWANGTMTLTVSGLPSGSAHIMGPFQISGGPCATGSGEAYMTTSSSTSVSYALASNPGACAGGTVKFPIVRQFDERVYQADSTQQQQTSQVDPPPAVTAIVN
jgi:hypothetical protein